MNICFISNFSKTYLFHKISVLLETRGFNVYWVAVNAELSEFLRKSYGNSRVLYLGKDYIHTDSAPAGDFRLNELIYGDRVLRHEKFWPWEYLKNIQQPFCDFIRSNEISFVFGELTWAHEVLFHRILADERQALNAYYLSPHTIRIPTKRFAFFKDEFQSEFFEARGAVTPANVGFSATRPDYLGKNDALQKKARSFGIRFGRVRNYLSRSRFDPKDPTLLSSRWTLLKVRISEEINKELYRFVRTRLFSSELAARPYILFTLHKQPEASIDVIGRFYEDQEQNIVNVWRSLPDGWSLIVKEHTNAIGDRAPSFYRRIKRLKNLILINETTDTYELIRHSRGVVTVSGTVAYEAALLGKRSYTFAPCFFNNFSECRRLGLDAMKQHVSWDEMRETESDNDEAKRYILRNSYSGVVSDYERDPYCFEKENVSNLADAFCKAFLPR